MELANHHSRPEVFEVSYRLAIFTGPPVFQAKGTQRVAKAIHCAIDFFENFARAKKSPGSRGNLTIHLSIFVAQ